MTAPSASALVGSLVALPAIDRLSERVRTSALQAAGARDRGFASPGWSEGAAPDDALTAEQAETGHGNALAILERGAQSADDEALLAALLALGVGRDVRDGRAGEASARLVWLAAHTRIDALEAIDAALGERAESVWRELARIAIDPAAVAPDFDASEAVVAAAALAASPSAAAKAAASDAAERTSSALVHSVLAPSRAAAGDAMGGELSPAPRNPALTLLLACTGILLVLHLARLVGRLALAYRRPARVTVDSRGLQLSHRTELLGRVLRDRDVLVPIANIARVTREVRFARLGLYAGLLALVIGSYLGMGLLVDGVRVGSAPLLGLAVAVIAVGLIVDFGLSNLADTARGRCRLVIVPRKGRALCIGGLDPARADAMLARLVHEPAAAPAPQP